MRFKAEVYVTLVRTVNDPEGLTVKGALAQLGFDEIDALRAGKYFELWLEAADEATATQRVDAMCAKLLANPVIEQYRVEVAAEAR